MKAPTNPVLLLTVAVPVLSLLAGIATIWYAYVGKDAELPTIYHWEGSGVEQDFLLMANARERGLQARLTFVRGGQVEVTLSGNQPIESGMLQLRLTHASNPGFDRVVELRRQGDDWVGTVRPLEDGGWRIELRADRTWLLRGRVLSPPSEVLLSSGATS
jgi:hypothetical protein